MRASSPTHSQSDPATISELIDNIDLTMVKRKLMDTDEGLGWGEDRACFAEARYRRFLYMTQAYPDRSIVPARDVDQFWHQHILDTRAYASDCARAFGSFLHHFPYFGMRGDADARNLDASFEGTKALYAELYGEDYCIEYGGTAGRCVKCGTGPVRCHHPPRCR